MKKNDSNLLHRESQTKIYSQNSIHGDDWFCTNGNLSKKVDESGNFRNFVGDTVVFLLQDTVMEQLGYLQDELYAKCEPILSQRLGKDTFHMTLHDLNAGTEKRNQEEACRLIYELRNSGIKSIKMHSTYLFNMVSTSVVLGFLPVDEENCRNLMGFYDRFQEIVPLSYSLSPHITMAYYKPRNFPMREMDGLREVIAKVNQREKIEMELELDKLVYQQFEHMNCYKTKM